MGQIIKLPGRDEPYVVKKGDTLDQIARLAMISPADKNSVIGPERKTGSYRGYPYTVGSEKDIELDKIQAARRKGEVIPAGGTQSDQPDLAPMGKISSNDLSKMPAGVRSMIKQSSVTDADRERILQQLQQYISDREDDRDPEMDRYLSSIDSDAARDRMRKALADWEKELQGQEARAKELEKFQQAPDYVDTDNIELKGANPDDYVPPIDVSPDDLEWKRNPELKETRSVLRRYIDILGTKQ